MQKSARSTFSATDKNALLDQVKIIIDAGELRSDSATIAQLDRNYRLDSAQLTRYTRAIESLNDRYGWHLDAQDVLLRLDEFKRVAELKSGKCSESRGWYGLKGNCKRGKKGEGKVKAKESKNEIADRVRSRKKMSTIRSRNGKMKNGSWDIGAAFAPGNEQQSSIRASMTGPNNSRELNPDRAARMMNKEQNRARVNWGKTTGDWKQTPDSTAAMDMVGPKPTPTPIAAGKSLNTLFSEADRLGAKYKKEPATMVERRIARENADRILQETGYTEAVARASGVASMEKARSTRTKAPASRQPRRSSPSTTMIDPAKTPVRIANSRSSNEPRKRGRSVD